MASHRQANFLKLLKKWPSDPDRPFRDYGSKLRELAKGAYPQGDVFKGNEEDKQQQFESFLRISEDVYFKKYPNQKNLSLSSLPLEDIRRAINSVKFKK